MVQVVADHNYSKAADVYSFGIIMWEMMTWDMPWEDLNAFQVLLLYLCLEGCQCSLRARLVYAAVCEPV